MRVHGALLLVALWLPAARPYMIPPLPDGRQVAADMSTTTWFKQAEMVAAAAKFPYYDFNPYTEFESTINPIAYGSASYCAYLARTDPTLFCHDSCKWWEYITGSSSALATASTKCPVKQCDVIQSVTPASVPVTCAPHTDYIVTAPLFRRPEGLEPIDTCKCKDQQTATSFDKCQVQPENFREFLGVHTTKAYCMLRSSHNLCRDSYQGRWSFGHFSTAFRYGVYGDRCVSRVSHSTQQDDLLKSWEIGPIGTFAGPWTEQYLKVDFETRSTWWHVQHNYAINLVLDVPVVPFIAGKSVETIKTLEWKPCSAKINGALMRNLWGVHTPVCREFGMNSAGRCTSYNEWSVMVGSLMNNHMTATHRDMIVSRTSVSFDLPPEVRVDFYSDVSCGNSVALSVEEQDYTAPVTNQKRTTYVAHDANMQSRFWRITFKNSATKCVTDRVCTEPGIGGRPQAAPFDYQSGFFECKTQEVDADDQPHFDYMIELKNAECYAPYFWRKWKRCADHSSAALDVMRCDVCEVSKPSRFNSLNERRCMACPSGTYFVPIYGCVQIPSIVKLNSVWMLRGWNPDTERVADTVLVISDTVQILYVLPADQTRLVAMSAEHFMDAQGVSVPCANDEDMRMFQYRWGCGLPDPAKVSSLDAWSMLVDASSAAGPIDAASAVASGVLYSLVVEGEMRDCHECQGVAAHGDSPEGLYNSGCRANTVQNEALCKWCSWHSVGDASFTQAGKEAVHGTVSCTAGYYVEHDIAVTGCFDDMAVTSTKCAQCMQNFGTANARGQMQYFLVVGCGFQSNWKRWNGETFSLTAVDCDWSATGRAACKVDLKDVTQSNDYKGMPMVAPLRLPLCPPGYYVKNIPSDPYAEYQSSYCSICHSCAGHLKPSKDWVQCPGHTTLDVQILAGNCVETCMSGYHEKKEQTATGEVTVCAKCSTTC